MATAYAYMTDEQLVQEITDYRAALKSFATGGQLKVIAGEGRRKEMTVGDSATIKAELRELMTEFNNRPSLSIGAAGGGSLLIEFGHGGGYLGGYQHGE